jgi:uncharacterized protein (DUF2236 family)
MAVMNPANLAVDKVFDATLRRRFFKGVRFDEPEGDPGWFGPESAVWYVHQHTPTLLLGLFAAALIETLHPDFAWMGEQHSRGVERVDGVPTGRLDPEGVLVRGGHSVAFFMAVAYGPTEAAERVTKAVRGMHHTIRGVRPDGRAYDADDPETLRWAYATVVWGIATAHERYHPRPLRGERLDDYYREFVRVGEALGGTDLPATKQEVLDLLLESVPLMGVTMPTADFVSAVGGAGFPVFIRPAHSVFKWAILDLQPPWAKKLLQVPRTSAPVTAARRAALWSLINAGSLAAGDLREPRLARARVRAVRAPLRSVAA